MSARPLITGWLLAMLLSLAAVPITAATDEGGELAVVVAEAADRESLETLRGHYRAQGLADLQVLIANDRFYLTVGWLQPAASARALAQKLSEEHGLTNLRLLRLRRAARPRQ